MRGFLLWIMVWVGTPVWGEAYRSGAIDCVQSQLASQGYYDGAIDGLWGPKTRDGLRELADELALEPRPLARAHKAIVWCRVLGEALPSLQAFWPRGASFDMHYSADVTDFQKARLNRAIDHATAYFDRSFDLQHIDHAKILVAGSKAQMLTLLRQHSSKRTSQKSIRATAARVCNKTAPVGANASYGIVSICFQPELRVLDGWTPAVRLGVQTMITHELTHLLQFELAGALTGVRSHAQALDRRGPTWLVEGVAEWVEIMTLPAPIRKQLIALGVDRAGTLKGALRNHENGGTVRDADAYRLSFSAAEMLSKRVDERDTLEFWRALGLGTSWRVAFERTYGLRPQEFYKRFEARSTMYEAF